MRGGRYGRIAVLCQSRARGPYFASKLGIISAQLLLYSSQTERFVNPFIGIPLWSDWTVPKRSLTRFAALYCPIYLDTAAQRCIPDRKARGGFSKPPLACGFIKFLSCHRRPAFPTWLWHFSSRRVHSTQSLLLGFEYRSCLESMPIDCQPWVSRLLLPAFSFAEW